MTVLDVDQMAVHFNTPDGVVQAVREISLRIEPGEVVGIVGESGSGKSVSVLSLLNLAPRGAKVVHGTAKLHGEDLLTMSAKRLRQVRGNDISMVFQDPISSLNPLMTVGAQIAEVLQIHRPSMKSQERRERVIELLKQVRIPEPETRLKAYPHELSGGMRQRVMIAQALAGDPDVLIADEPTTALDVTVQRQILELLLQIRDERGMAVIFITHDLGVVAEICDRVLVMYGGLVMEATRIDTLMRDPQHPYTIGLMACAPTVDADRDEELRPIPGSPPNLLHPPAGCPFAPRCEVAMSICHEHVPPLFDVAKSADEAHTSRCWLQHDQVPEDVLDDALETLRVATGGQS